MSTFSKPGYRHHLVTLRVEVGYPAEHFKNLDAAEDTMGARHDAQENALAFLRGESPPSGVQVKRAERQAFSHVGYTRSVPWDQ